MHVMKMTGKIPSPRQGACEFAITLIQDPPDFNPAYRRVKACIGAYRSVQAYTDRPYTPLRAYTRGKNQVEDVSKSEIPHFFFYSSCVFFFSSFFFFFFFVESILSVH